ncbi:tetratricopeptide repeat protein [Algibacter aquimarinus]|uniref:Tetratricopeptide repeat protein n=1 Tax=Algibacter aquimarinus TaxID=1136748 RepID=A0ABP9HN47_9FLAO
MRKILFFLFLSIPLCFSGQNQKKIDSLKASLGNIESNKERMDTYGRLWVATAFKKPKESKIYLDSFSKYATNYFPNKRGQKERYTGDYYKSIDNYKEAEKHYLQAVAFYDSVNSKKSLHKSLNSLAEVQRHLGDFESALASVLRSLKEKEADEVSPLIIAKDYVSIGNIHGMLKNYSLSNDYFKKAEKIYIEKNKRYSTANVKMNIGLNYKNLKIPDSAFKYYYASKNLYEGGSKVFKKSVLYNNIGVLHEDSGQNDSTLFYYNKGLSIAKKYKKANDVILISNNIGNTLLDINQPEKALAYYETGLELSKSTGNNARIMSSYRGLSKAHDMLNNKGKSLNYYKNYVKIKDSLYKIESLETINALEVKYQTEKKESEIAIQQEEIKNLNIKAENDKLTKTLYGIGMFSLLTISGLVFISFRQRIKKNRIEREKQEAIYKQEIAFKKKELASQTLHLVQKNTFIQELKENLVKIKQSPELFKVEFRRLVMLLKKENAEDKDWEVFKSYFSEVHNNFDNKLKDIYADISEKEIRLASFLRMNLSTKEIASMLNVLPDSVLKSKYRLKKKLNLTKETDLMQFLNTL